MAYMCQGCSAEGEVWTGECPACHGKLHLTLAPKKADLIGQVIDGRYKVVDKLGQGGMGTVYKAIREGMGQILAIKVLNPEFSNEPEVVRRFLREAKSYGLVQHPNAVNLLDFGQTPDQALYIAMEYIAGTDLARVIQDQHGLSLSDAIDVGIQCCDVLGYAHEKGIIHRDLKPENIMLVRGLRNYHAKVLDFGIARLVSDNATQLTVQGTICGTPRYMSPEQARGKDIDNRSDIYSLGLVMFETLTGRQAYTHSSITELLRAQVTEPVPHLWEIEEPKLIPEALDAVIQKACAKDREQRYVSMGQFADALSKALPTMNDLRPFTGSHLALPSQGDPAAPGRTFLGPGAVGAIAVGGSSSPGVTNGTLPPNDDSRTYVATASKLDAAVGVSQAAIPAANLLVPPAGAALGDQGTLLKAPAPIQLEAPRGLSQERAPEARPDAHRAAPASSKTPLLVGALVVLSLAIGAVLLVPRLGSHATEAGKVEPVPTPPIATPTPPKVVETAPKVVETHPKVVETHPKVIETAPKVIETHPKIAETVPDKPPVKVGHTAHAGGTSLAVKTIKEQAMESEYINARGSLSDGKLRAALEHLANISADSAYAARAGELKQKIGRVGDLLAKAKGLRNAGQCDQAVGFYKDALEISPGLGEAHQGIRDCQNAALPTTLDP